MQMFTLISSKHEARLNEIISSINEEFTGKISLELAELINEIREEIPKKKRISYGRYSIIKKMGIMMYPSLIKNNIDPFNFSLKLFEYKQGDQFVRSLSLQILSIYAIKQGNPSSILPYFEQAAIDEKWEVRECSAGFIRKLIREHPKIMEKWYTKIVLSNNPQLRRFASESIRPVADNKWFKKNPDFCFSILKHLYHENHPYPRSSVGNNLSDWSKIDKERVFRIIEDLVKNNDKNSYWIAYRACRNLVKIEPSRVMDLLDIDKYTYKKKIYQRSKECESKV